ncbi:Chromosome (plasmid) partitioning protein ParB [hydrothermal vent metagenome]|uniref:Chromosome (Plasmid) partitioning protein ParB n=1 Tax=hydrothermal vent metagenome TaxID=652676 RepID=A0A3B0RV10_9ZZZZ
MSKKGKETGLGRGLSALLGEQVAVHPPQTNASKTQNVAIDLLQRNPEQPRRHFDETEMQRLTDSISKQGVLQPILVRAIAGSPQYQIVAGERRWRAAQAAGLHEIPVYVRELSDREVVEVALVENIQRADLNPVEEAQAFRVLLDQFGHTQQDVATAIGRSRSHIANTVRLLDLPKPVQELLISQQISAGHGRALLAAKDPALLAEQIITQGLSVRQAEKKSRSSRTAPETKSRRSGKSTDSKALEKQLSQSLGLQVNLQQNGTQKGTLSIQYQSLEQLDDLCRRLNNN